MKTFDSSGQAISSPAAALRVWIVVPCYNEAKRLDTAAFESYIAQHPSIGFAFVNDGSRDGTLEMLHALARRHGDQVHVIDQQPNSGKAEAVRVGMLWAMSQQVEFAGYFDADLATPLSVIQEFVEILDRQDEIDIAIGSRVALLGRQIERKPMRHYAGRVFATAASMVLAIPIYDTQCGAKLMRVTPAMRELFDKKFGSRWIFDVELLARYLVGHGSQRGIYEHPLQKWTDVGESKVKGSDFIRAGGEMASIYRNYQLPRHSKVLLGILSAPFLRYVGVGGLGTLLHYLLLIAGVEVLRQPPWGVAPIGALLGSATNYFFNYHLTFSSTAPHRQTLPRYAAFALAAAVLTGIGMYAGNVVLGWNYLLVQLLCTALVLMLGFVVHQGWTFSSVSDPAPDARNTRQVVPLPLLLWGILRLPALVVLAYFLREPILAWIESHIDIIYITHLAIDIASTPLSRALCFVGVASVLSLSLWLCGRWFGVYGWVVNLAISVLLLLTLCTAFETRRERTILVLLVLIANLAQNLFLDGSLRTWLAQQWFFAAAVGIAEGLFLGRYLRWLLGWRGMVQQQNAREMFVLGLPGVLLVSMLTAILIGGGKMVRVEQALRMPASVKIVDRGDINGLAVDRQARHLYATGQGLDRVRRYDLQDLAAPPLESNASIAAAQSLEYVGDSDEIYVYNAETREILVFCHNLRLKRRIAVRDLSPGDPWIAVDKGSNTITIASEADVQEGVPLVVLDLQTGKVLDARDEEAGNLLLNPASSIVYLSFFRRTSGIMGYDLRERKIACEATSDQRIDRMTFWPEKNELLAASPLRARVIRYDAKTLERKGFFAANSGVRTLAIDAQRGLLLCGSLSTGNVSLIELASGRVLDSYYLGPWLRSIVVVPERGIAYLSSNGTLYELNYAQGR